jgi:hypothetical protein
MGLFKVKLTSEIHWGGVTTPVGTVFTVYDTKHTNGVYFLIYVGRTWHWLEGYDCVPFTATDQFDQDLKELIDGN